MKSSIVQNLHVLSIPNDLKYVVLIKRSDFLYINKFLSNLFGTNNMKNSHRFSSFQLSRQYFVKQSRAALDLGKLNRLLCYAPQKAYSKLSKLLKKWQILVSNFQNGVGKSVIILIMAKTYSYWIFCLL